MALVEQGVSPCSVLMELSTLPDDELLQVLSYLSMEELVQCRAVCSRWALLAFHPLLWRNRNIHVGPFYGVTKGLAGAALRLAPCLRSLHTHRFSELMDVCGALLTSTRCAIAGLDIQFRPEDAVCVAMVLARQASLGRLKEVSLHVELLDTTSAKRRLRGLFQQLVYTPGLHSIKVEALGFRHGGGWPSLLGATGEHDSVAACLRRLEYENVVDPYMPLHLEWHASTLEEVQVARDAPRLAVMLSCLPRLRRLVCPLLEDMPALLQCASLQSVRLHVDLDDATRPHLPGVRTFLRTAVTRLERLTLDYEDGESRGEAVDLVLCLSGTATAAASLRFLSIHLWNGGKEGSLDRVPPPHLQVEWF